MHCIGRLSNECNAAVQFASSKLHVAVVVRATNEEVILEEAFYMGILKTG
eukprot:SAG11_NODE_6032_length_1405_cov_2.457121_1_plen_50_part_00